MALSGLYGLMTLAIVACIFLVLYKKRGWKMALGASLLALGILVILFVAFLTFALNAMG